MKTTRALTLAVLLCCLTSLSPAQPKDGYFAGGYAAVYFRHHLWTGAGTTDFVRQSFVGDLGIYDEYYLINLKPWQLILTSDIQFLYGGLKQRQAKLYAGSFRINLGVRYLLPWNGFYAQLSGFHVSTHYIDPIDVAGVKEAQDLEQIHIEVKDVNLVRIEVGQEMANYAYSFGMQPLQMQFFLLAEPNRMFAHDAFVPHDRRFFLNGLATVWRNESFRVAVAGQSELEQRIRYLVKAVISTHLGETPRLDKIQVSLAYQGGIEPNNIVIVPQSGIGREWWFLEARFFL